MTYDELVALALAKPETLESTSYRTPCVKRKKHFMFRLKEDGLTVAIKMDWDSHNLFLEKHPEVAFKTPHYEGYPAFLVRLEGLAPELAEELVTASWRDAPLKAKPF